MADWYQKNSEEALQELHSRKEGLTDDEVSRRQEQYGFNELKEKEGIGIPDFSGTVQGPDGDHPDYRRDNFHADRRC